MIPAPWLTVIVGTARDRAEGVVDGLRRGVDLRFGSRKIEAPERSKKIALIQEYIRGLLGLVGRIGGVPGGLDLRM